MSTSAMNSSVSSELRLAAHTDEQILADLYATRQRRQRHLARPARSLAASAGPLQRTRTRSGGAVQRTRTRHTGARPRRRCSASLALVASARPRRRGTGVSSSARPPRARTPGSSGPSASDAGVGTGKLRRSARPPRARTQGQLRLVHRGCGRGRALLGRCERAPWSSAPSTADVGAGELCPATASASAGHLDSDRLILICPCYVVFLKQSK
jgi:hypothetical protein